MTVIASLVYGLGDRHIVIVRCLTAVIAIWFVLSMCGFLFLSKPSPDILDDIRQYWIGPAISVGAVVFQLIYDKKQLRMLFRLKRHWDY